LCIIRMHATQLKNIDQGRLSKWRT
jgi:hypothetical protein